MSGKLYRFKYDEFGNTREIVVYASGSSAQSCSFINKGTAFNMEERSQLNLEASLPPGIRDLRSQVETSRLKLQEKNDNIEKFIFIRSLFDRNVTLAHALIASDIEQYSKIIYTPTVGLAVQKFSSMFRQANGLHFYPGNIDHAEDILRRFSHRDIRVAVVTDNQGILGLGDQGAGGIAVCLGKLMLYTQGAGIAPWHCLPVSLDVGTDNEKLLADKHYLGWRHHRLEGEAYLSFIGRFVRAFRNVYPSALCQWEDFSYQNAFSIHDAFVDEIISFNDDIQGTGCVAVAAMLSAMKIKEQSLTDQVFLIQGAGVSGVGVAEQVCNSLKDQGLTEKEALRRIYMVDSTGLIIKGRNLPLYKKKYAKNRSDCPWLADINPIDIPSIIEKAKVTVLVGTTGQASFFSNDIISSMKKNTSMPVILPLFHNMSTPENAVCGDLQRWSNDGVLIGTGSFCDSLERLGSTSPIGQCNNAFVFPGVGLGVLASGATEVLPEFFTAAAKAIADTVTSEQLALGRLMPSIDAIRDVGKKVAEAVAHCAIAMEVSRPCIYSDFQHNHDIVRMSRLIDRIRWRPEYLPLVPM
jgi:malate dehydrogenase (oxaloacetate-decarboxylating)